MIILNEEESYNFRFHESHKFNYYRIYDPLGLKVPTRETI